MFLGINLPWKKTPSGDVQIGGAVLSPGRRNIAPRRGVGSYWIAPDTVAAGRTGIARLQAPIGAVGCYLNFQHYGSNPADIAKFGVLPIANATANTGTSAYTLGKFGGAASGVVPAASPETHPVSSRVYAGQLRSDFIAFTAVARTDYPTRGPLLDVAFQVGTRPITAGIFAPIDDVNTPTVLGWNATDTDILAAPASTPMAAYMPTYVWAEWVYAGTRAPVMFAAGDSILDGIGASKIGAGFVQKSAFASGIELYSETVGGRTSYDTWDALRRDLPRFASQVDAVALQAWSPNDEVQGFSVDDVFARYLVEKAWIEAMGISVITVGPVPANGSSGPALVRGKLLGAGVDFFDAGILMATNATLLAWKAGRSDDNIHGNDTGYAELTIGFRQHLSTRVVAPPPTRFVAQSVAQMQSAAGVAGQRCLCLDPLLPAAGVECEWDATAAMWVPIRGQYLVDVGPTVGQAYFAQFTPASTSTVKTKIGTIPKNLVATGRQIYVEAVVEANGAAASFLSFGFNTLTAPTGAGFSGSAASTRVYSRDGAPIINAEGSGAVASTLRQLASGGATSTLAVDFAADVDVYVVVSSPVVGVQYTIRRASVKVGGE